MFFFLPPLRGGIHITNSFPVVPLHSPPANGWEASGFSFPIPITPRR